ncbi:Two-component response regulator, FixJ family, consists of REC and HTH domains [Luteibacter sp. UNCMF331Sha3.1]|jgi:FixJ family two-component response regulator|uniref:response regulator transcription factor n=1 Tax=Luteibacter sp. UNCMF331Sha3.1 TaxID=1502760 RepID=UPI0008C44791|nr:response regulator [Luteibacter sp. UNCMF331Sha3.1]SEM53965.1 Two-component response regulator, FixJ family, consists of REC and HTH domains [Luteibacter sp. UNCMF331Sha3.1]
MTDSENDEIDVPVCIIDDDEDVRSSIANLLRSCGHVVETFSGPAEFKGRNGCRAVACLILDVRLKGANGLDFQEELLQSQHSIPIVLMSGHGDVPMTVRGMRAGAITFLPKPFREEELLAAVREAIGIGELRRRDEGAHAELRNRFVTLTPRERDVLGLVAAGLMNKQIAGQLAISEITVKIHRGNAMRKMKADSLADLVRMAEKLGARENQSRYGRAQSID